MAPHVGVTVVFEIGGWPLHEDTDFLILRRQVYPHPEDGHMDLVLVHLIYAAYRPFVIWAYNRLTDGYGTGDYFASQDEAEAAFDARYARLEQRARRL